MRVQCCCSRISEATFWPLVLPFLPLVGVFAAAPFPFAWPLLPVCEWPLLPFMPWPLAPFACMPLPFWPGSCPLLAAMASSVYAVLSPLAKTLKASRIGLYPVQRLRRMEHSHLRCQDCISYPAKDTYR